MNDADRKPEDDFPPMRGCPVCMLHDTPMWWLCQRVSRREGVDHYALLGCKHTIEVAEWEFPPHGFTPDRKRLAEAWNAWCEDAESRINAGKQPISQ